MLAGAPSPTGSSGSSGSDPEAERHRGLTYFLVPMDSPGVTVRPIAQLDGETGFAEVFFEDVAVPATQVLGGVDEGW